MTKQVAALDPWVAVFSRGWPRTESNSEALATVEAELFGIAPRPRRLAGRYRLLERIGKGGFGVVYRALDERLGRDVAIKIDNASTRDPLRRKRFMREGRVLAQLSHANIVPVFDVGIDEKQRRFMVMELVDGPTLARPARWSAKKIVELYRAAGRGLAAAHRQGIVHRDFKPSNVLWGEDGRVRVADFGMASVGTDPADHGSGDDAQPEADDRFTLPGAVLGTPRYMAPEQKAGTELGPATDQYAFCFALVEALAQPRKGEAILDAAARLPRRLRRALGTGLAQRPEDRWATMDGLLQAMQPRSRWPALGVGAAVVIAAGAAAMVGDSTRSCHGAAKAEQLTVPERRARVRAAFETVGAPQGTAQSAMVEAGIGRFADDWAQTYRQLCRAAASGGERWDAQLRCLQDRWRTMDAIVTALEGIEAVTAGKALEAVASVESPGSCEHVAAQDRLEPPAELRSNVDEIRDVIAQARALQRSGQPAAALVAARRAHERARAVGYGPALAETLHAVGALQFATDDLDDAEATLEEAYFAARAAGEVGYAVRSATLLLRIAGAHRMDAQGARRWTGHARAALQERPGPTYLHAIVENELGAVALLRGETDAAIEHFQNLVSISEQVWGADDPRLVGDLTNLASALNDAGELQAAEAAVLRALGLARAGDTELIQPLRLLGAVRLAMDRRVEARTALERALTIATATFGPEHTKTAGVHLVLGTVAIHDADYDAAFEHYSGAAAIYTRVRGEDHPSVGDALNNLGLVAAKKGDWTEAESLYQRALGSFQSHGLEGQQAMVLGNLGELYLDAGQLERSNAAIDQVVELAAAHPALTQIFANALTTRGMARLAAGDVQAAADALQHSAQVRHDQGFAPSQTAATELALSEALWRLGRTDDAIARAWAGLHGARSGQPSDHAQVQRALQLIEVGL